MKTIFQYLVSALILIPLAALFLPLFYIAFLGMLVFLPIVLYIDTLFIDRDKESPLTLKFIVEQSFSILICLPMVLFMITSLLRSMVLMLYSLHPKSLYIFNDLHYSTFYPTGIEKFGEMFPYWLDVYWGLAGILTIFILAILDSIRRNMLVRQIEILPTSKIHAAAIGLVELKGKAVPITTKKDEPLILSRFQDMGDGSYGTYTQMFPFYIDDGTGRILVNPRGCTVASDKSFFEMQLHHAILKSYKQENKLDESRLMPGDEIYVLGNLQINDDPDYADDKVIIKPQKSGLRGFHIYDLFFVSNTSEEKLIEAFRKAIKRGWRGVFLTMMIPAWLAINGWTNVTQLKTMEVESAPLPFRLLTTQTVLERSVTINNETQTSNYWLEQMRSHPDKIDDIMSALKEQRLQTIAIPFLQEQAQDIDHPAFAISNYWLQKLNANPVGHWGHQNTRQDYLDEYEQKDNTFVARVMFSYQAPELLASYRVHFGQDHSGKLELTRRHVVFELTHLESGTKKTMEFFAEDGWNNADGVRVFDYFLPGEYEVYVYARRQYRNGLSDKGTRRFKAFKANFLKQ